MSCPINRPGLVAAGACQLRQADKDQTKLVLMNFQVFFREEGGVVSKKLKAPSTINYACCSSSILCYFSTIKCRNIIIKKMQRLRSDCMASVSGLIAH